MRTRGQEEGRKGKVKEKEKRGGKKQVGRRVIKKKEAWVGIYVSITWEHKTAGKP